MKQEKAKLQYKTKQKTYIQRYKTKLQDIQWKVQGSNASDGTECKTEGAALQGTRLVGLGSMPDIVSRLYIGSDCVIYIDKNVLLVSKTRI